MNELVIRNTTTNSLSTIATNDALSDPFDKDTTDIIEQFTDSWINNERSTQSNIDATTCNENISAGATLCKVNFCDDECQCTTVSIIKTFNGQKRQQCDYDLAACLGFVEGTTECRDWQNSDNQARLDYLNTNAQHCGDLVTTVKYPYVYNKRREMYNFKTLSTAVSTNSVQESQIFVNSVCDQQIDHLDTQHLDRPRNQRINHQIYRLCHQLPDQHLLHQKTLQVLFYSVFVFTATHKLFSYEQMPFVAIYLTLNRKSNIFTINLSNFKANTISQPTESMQNIGFRYCICCG